LKFSASLYSLQWRIASKFGFFHFESLFSF
jgi:hypothetical protein